MAQNIRQYPGGTLKLRQYYRSEILARFMSEAEMAKIETEYSANSSRTVHNRQKPTPEETEIGRFAAVQGPQKTADKYSIKKAKVYTIISKIATWNFYNPSDQVGLTGR